jgi:hypothetical protein
VKVVRVTLLCLGLMTPHLGFADRAAYTEVSELVAESGGLRFSQVLDPELREFPRGATEANSENPFLREHRPIFVELSELDSGDLIFRRHAPNLTHLWIDPNSRFFVGLSKVKLNNQVQLIIYDRGGALVHAEHVAPDGACLSDSEWNLFTDRFPQSVSALQEVTRSTRSGYFVHFHRMGMPNGLRRPAWDFLYQHGCTSPYSSRFRESVTNWVSWFDEAAPSLELVYGDGPDPIGLLVREPEWPICNLKRPEDKERCGRSQRRFLVPFQSHTR